MITQIENSVIDSYRKRALIYVQRHPELNLRILNYSAACSWEKAWDEVTLCCRGLVVDGEGFVVARCLPKFFNYSELVNANYKIPKLPFQIFTKMDGSYIQLFWYKNQWVVSSRGSFTSDHAGWAWEILESKKQNFPDYLDYLDKSNTYIFELLHPENRIVVDYKGAKDLILLAIINNETGVEVNTIFDVYDKTYYGFTKVKCFDGIEDYTNLKIPDDEEGFVVRFSDGFRMKIKGDEYCRLHKVMTNMTSKDVWTAYCDGMTFEQFIEPLPDELFDWVDKIWKQMENQETDRLKDCIVIWHNIKNKLGESQSKKDWAIEIQKEDQSIRAILFFLADGRVSEARKLIKNRFCKPDLEKCWIDKSETV